LSRHDCCDRIPNGLSRNDVARLEIHLDRIHEHVRGFDDRVQLFLIFCRQQRRVNQTQAKRSDRASHSVHLRGEGEDYSDVIIRLATEVG
jgi:hypothetical protein